MISNEPEFGPLIWHEATDSAFRLLLDHSRILNLYYLGCSVSECCGRDPFSGVEEKKDSG